MPSFLIPIIVLEVIALITVICGLWLLLTNKLEPDEPDGVAQRGWQNKTTRTAPARVNVPASADQPSIPADIDDLPSPTSAAAAKPDLPERAAIVSHENGSDEIDPSWPAPTPKSS